MIRFLFLSFFIQCLTVAATPIWILPDTAIIDHIQIAVDLPIDRDENSKLVQYLSSLLKTPANEKAKVFAQNHLEALKIYKQIQCEFQGKQPNITLSCQIKRIPIIHRIIIENLPIVLLEKDLRKRLPITAGEIFDVDSASSETQMSQIQKTVASFLERQGYYDAQVTIDYKPILNTSTLDIIIHIKGGSFRFVNKVTLSPNISFDQTKITGMFRNMCRSFRYIFEAGGTGGFNCYSRERERETIQNLQNLLAQRGYDIASISTQKVILDPLAPNLPRKCKPTRLELKQFQKNDIKPPARCLDIHVAIDLGPQIITEFIFEKAQTLSLSGVKSFFRNLFGIEFFSRLFDTSFVGAKWPADQTILINELRNATTFSTARKIDEKEIAQSIKNIKFVLAKRGYSLADVQAEQDNIQNQIIYLRFFINPKQPLNVTEIHFMGNPIFSKQEILKEVSLTVLPRSATNSGHFDDTLIDADIEKIKLFYINQGYLSAQVESKKRVFGTEIHLWYQINPGSRHTVKELFIENGHPELLPQILPLLSNCQNAKKIPKDTFFSTSICSESPYLSHAISDDENRILDVYHAHGYLHAKVKTKIIEKDLNTTVIFYLNPPDENQRAQIKNTLIDGNVATKSSVLMRQAGSSLFLPNRVLDLPKLEEGIAKLRQTNLYSHVRYRYLNQDEHYPKLDILLSVTEKPSLSLDLSLGFSTDDLFSIGAQLNEFNLLGNMLQLTSEMDLGLFWGRKSNIKNTFRWPWIYGLPLDFEFVVPQMVYTERPTRDPPERHFLTQLISSLEWQLSPTTYPYLKHEIRWDKWQQQYNPTQFNQDFSRVIQSFDGLSYVLAEPATVRSVLTPGINYIKVDHPFNPKNGLKLNFSTDLSFSVLGAQIPFQILNAQIAHYVTSGPFTFASQLILRRGFIENPVQRWWVLKYQSDMDSLGGDRSVRGFQPGTIGIWGEMRNNRDGKILLDNNQQPVMGYHPGNLSIQGNLEVRFPFKKDILFGDLDGAIFTDFAFIDNCKSLFNCNNPDLSNPNSQLGWSVGLGLRYVLPIGPVSLDYAISPIQRANNWLGRQSRIHLLFGYSF